MIPNGQTLAGRVLRLPLRLIPPDTVVTVRRGLTAGMKWRVGASTHGCWLGTYEAGKQAAIRKLVKPGMNVFDIGANAGYYTLALAALGAKVWAFEPLAENVANLLHHVRINALEVTVIQAAVSDRDGLAGFRIAPDNSMGSLTVTSDYLVPTVTLDNLIATSAAPIPDIVKMDVEGAEALVLQGAAELLRARRTTWLISLHGIDQRDQCQSLLTAAGLGVTFSAADEIVAI